MDYGRNAQRSWNTDQNHLYPLKATKYSSRKQLRKEMTGPYSEERFAFYASSGRKFTLKHALVQSVHKELEKEIMPEQVHVRTTSDGERWALRCGSLEYSTVRDPY
jgi:hypothetical protein